MAVSKVDIIRIGEIPDDVLSKLIDLSNRVAKNIVDRKDLHKRDYLERFMDVLLGEIAENAVINWLKNNGKFAESAVDKCSSHSDPGHDLILRTVTGNEIKCSVKSSIAALKGIDDIVDQFTLATKETELRDVNIQVYFWLDLFASDGYRTTVPSTRNFALIGWSGIKDITKFNSYATESREAPDLKLKKMRPMRDLLEYLQ
jgi:hypothetical protein